MKHILLIYCCFIFTGCDLITPWDWGHHFEFTNKMNIEIDSLIITVGNEENTIVIREYGISANIAVPKRGYPHKVEIKIFSGEKTQSLIADSFDAYNGDGTHEYILRNDSALYKFHN